MGNARTGQGRESGFSGKEAEEPRGPAPPQGCPRPPMERGQPTCTARAWPCRRGRSLPKSRGGGESRGYGCCWGSGRAPPEGSPWLSLERPGRGWLWSGAGGPSGARNSLLPACREKEQPRFPPAVPAPSAQDTRCERGEPRQGEELGWAGVGPREGWGRAAGGLGSLHVVPPQPLGERSGKERARIQAGGWTGSVEILKKRQVHFVCCLVF